MNFYSVCFEIAKAVPNIKRTFCKVSESELLGNRFDLGQEKKNKKAMPFLIFCNDSKNLISFVGKSHLNKWYFMYCCSFHSEATNEFPA